MVPSSMKLFCDTHTHFATSHHRRPHSISEQAKFHFYFLQCSLISYYGLWLLLRWFINFYYRTNQCLNSRTLIIRKLAMYNFNHHFCSTWTQPSPHLLLICQFQFARFCTSWALFLLACHIWDAWDCQKGSMLFSFSIKIQKKRGLVSSLDIYHTSTTLHTV